MKSVRVVVGILVVALFGAGPQAVSAQESSGVAFVGGIGYRTGSPGPALVDGLMAAGLDGTRSQVCIGCEPQSVDFPFYFDEGLALAAFIGARYKFAFPLTVEVLGSNGPRGHAEGFNNDTREHLIVKYASFLLTGSLSTHFGPVGIEAGPALAVGAWDTVLDNQKESSTTSVTVGTHASIFGRFYVRDMLLTVRTGRRWIPSADLSGLSFQTGTGYQASYVSITVSPWITD